MIINITGIPRERNNLQIYPASCTTTNISIISSSPSTSSAPSINLTSNIQTPNKYRKYSIYFDQP